MDSLILGIFFFLRCKCIEMLALNIQLQVRHVDKPHKPTRLWTRYATSCG